jgi:hypothetical protein
MSLISELQSRIPEQHLDLLGVPDGPVKTAALEAAYDDGFTGCFLPDDNGPSGRAAKYYADEFKDAAGKDSYLFEQLAFDDPLSSETETGYIATLPAFTAWKRDRDQRAIDWLFAIFQNFGNCVDASLVELFHAILGLRAMDPANNEVFRWLMAFYAYAFRGYCGHGWYIPTAASVTLTRGYCFALPEIAGVKYLAENDSEYAVSNRPWCASGPPTTFRQHVDSNGWRFEQGSITQFSGGVEGLKNVIRRKGQVHHGSNHTSGSSIPGRALRSIGGHAQTLFGGDWSERTLKFFRDKGITAFSASNFPVVNHQTWGGSWSGATAAQYWPEWWGERPQGAWVCTANQAVTQLFRSAYVYLPNLKGWKREGPPPTPEPGEVTKLSGILKADNASPIRGELIAGEGANATNYIIIPDGQGGYKPVRKAF